MDQKFEGLPTTAVGSPAPPSTVGKLVQPSLPADRKSAALVLKFAYAQEPCRIIAARPVYSRARSELLSVAIEENPSANPPALTSCWIIVLAWMTAGSDQAFGLLSWMAWKTSGPPIRSVRYSSHISCGHLLWPPMDSGAMPAAFKVATSARSSSQVAGGFAIPAWLSRSLLKYRTTGCTELFGTAYVLPSTWPFAAMAGKYLLVNEASS